MKIKPFKININTIDMEEPYNQLISNPHLIIKAAVVKSITGFALNTDLLEAIRGVSPTLGKMGGSDAWQELLLLMKTDTPSIGINFLQEVGALRVFLPELENCFGVEQNTKYHKHTVYEHCVLACDSCVKRDPRIRFAALIHDTGKPHTKGKNSNGITFHKHEVVSTKLSKKIMKRFEVGRADSDFITSLVLNHMYHYDRQWKPSTVIRFISRVGLNKTYINRMSKFPLFQLRHADRMGRGLNPITKKQLDFEQRLEKILREDLF